MKLILSAIFAVAGIAILTNAIQDAEERAESAQTSLRFSQERCDLLYGVKNNLGAIVENLTVALSKYGEHSKGCHMRDDGNQCDCGLMNALFGDSK